MTRLCCSFLVLASVTNFLLFPQGGQAIEEPPSEVNHTIEPEIISSTQGDPCLGLCGLNTECLEVNSKRFCTCKTGFSGDPLIACTLNVKPECNTNRDCPAGLACLNQLCTDPCLEGCGINTKCLVVNHQAVCSCKQGFSWNAASGCQPVDVPQCRSNGHCSKNRVCVNQKCVDPCVGLCGTNTVCSVFNHIPSCACSTGFIGNPFTGCNPQPTFRVDVDIVNQTRKHRSSTISLNVLLQKVLVPSTVKLSWRGALGYCRDSDMDLASIESQEEQDQVEKLAKQEFSSEALWLGGHDLGEVRKFIWLSTGKAPTYTHWAPNETPGSNMNCIRMMSDFYWETVACDYQLHFFCQYYKF